MVTTIVELERYKSITFFIPLHSLFHDLESTSSPHTSAFNLLPSPPPPHLNTLIPYNIPTI
jgi:hypothetical protein